MNVSVVIPVKNRPISLVRAVESASRQSIRPLEIIIVDDGSTDETPDVVSELTRTENLVRSLRFEQSGGAPVARNAGGAAAKGQLIAFLDSDDVWKPSKLERQIELLEEYPNAPAAFSGFEYHYSSRKIRRSIPPTVVYSHDLFEKNILGGTSSVLIRKSAFDIVGGFLVGMPSCQDWELWLRLAALYPLVSVPEALVEYHFDGGGRISKNRSNVERGHEIIFETIQKMVVNPGERRRVMAKQAMRMSEVYAKQFGDTRATFKQVCRGLSLDLTVRNAAAAIRSIAHLVI